MSRSERTDAGTVPVAGGEKIGFGLLEKFAYFFHVKDSFKLNLFENAVINARLFKAAAKIKIRR